MIHTAVAEKHDTSFFVLMEEQSGHSRHWSFDEGSGHELAKCFIVEQCFTSHAGFFHDILSSAFVLHLWHVTSSFDIS